MNLPDAERATRIDLQKRIQAAVLGQGTWDDIPEPLKRQASTAWFQSFLPFTPASVMPKVKQPLLILQGTIDRQVPAHHAERLADLARARKKMPADAVQVVTLEGVNHLLVAAKTGDLDETTFVVGPSARPARGAGDDRLAGQGPAAKTLRFATEAQKLEGSLGSAHRATEFTEIFERHADALGLADARIRERICQVVT